MQTQWRAITEQMHIFSMQREPHSNECLCVCVYSLLIAHNVQSSHFETPIKCYYRRKYFHLLSFYYETFASVYIYVYVWEKELWGPSGFESMCVYRLTYMCVCACAGVCTVCGGSDQMLCLGTVRTVECSAHHWWYEMASEEHRTNPALMLLFLIKHALLFVWVLSQWINVNGLSRAVYHRSRVKLGIKGSWESHYWWFGSS